MKKYGSIMIDIETIKKVHIYNKKTCTINQQNKI